MKTYQNKTPLRILRGSFWRALCLGPGIIVALFLAYYFFGTKDIKDIFSGENFFTFNLFRPLGPIGVSLGILFSLYLIYDFIFFLKSRMRIVQITDGYINHYKSSPILIKDIENIEFNNGRGNHKRMIVKLRNGVVKNLDISLAEPDICEKFIKETFQMLN